MFSVFNTILLTAAAIGLGLANAANIPAQYAPLSKHIVTAVVITHTTTEIIGVSTAIDVGTLKIDCYETFCQGKSSMCVYWAGVTGWDADQGIQPGMTVMPYAPCHEAQNTGGAFPGTSDAATDSETEETEIIEEVTVEETRTVRVLKTSMESSKT